MIPLEIHFLGVIEEERKILKVVFLENGSTDFDEKIYVVETNEAIPQKKEFMKKIETKKTFWIFRNFFLRLCSRVTTAIFHMNMPQNILHNIYWFEFF